MSGSMASAQHTAPRLASRAVRSGRQSRRGCSVVCAAGQALKGVRLVGCGSSVPQSFLTNKDMESLVETNDEWIATRTGIRKRHILAEGESLSSHAALASQRALEMAGAWR